MEDLDSMRTSAAQLRQSSYSDPVILATPGSANGAPTTVKVPNNNDKDKDWCSSSAPEHKATVRRAVQSKRVLPPAVKALVDVSAPISPSTVGAAGASGAAAAACTVGATEMASRKAKKERLDAAMERLGATNDALEAATDRLATFSVESLFD